MITVLAGCVNRELKVITNPENADVYLNGEQIGKSPASVNFNWYGTYDVKIAKKGFKTLEQTAEIKRPLHDYFPLDIFAGIFNSGKTYTYRWHFDLEKASEPSREALIERADNFAEKSGAAPKDSPDGSKQ
ncbi:PEGA domain-containing protein [Sedimentisphaera cyanobacteriorum]|uniref:PEGA domain-containing protein n=1 Tax=Sedimentisphaera cyanobacteriorum TaxID=1940790 RepID=UPI001372EDF9|nr:PEGA domain-containing protein [Sedimentisphaera cyanobacteriorum]